MQRATVDSLLVKCVIVVKHCSANWVYLLCRGGGQSTQLPYLSESTDTVLLLCDDE